MTRIYLFDRFIPRNSSISDYNAYSATYEKWHTVYGNRIKLNTDDSDHFQIWLEFETEEEAAVWKLTNL